VNLGQMRGQVQQWLGLQDISSYDETQLAKDLIYQGTLDMLARTKCVVRCVELNVSGGVDTYILDHSIMALVDVEDGARRRARRDQSTNSPDSVDEVIVYPAGSIDTTPTMFTLIRADILRLSPVPAANGQVQVWGVLKPQQMSADSDSPSDEIHGAIPEEWHDVPVLYALWKASDYADDASSQQGERYRALYEGADGRGGRLAQIRVAVNKRGTARAANRRVSLKPVWSSGAWVG